MFGKNKKVIESLQHENYRLKNIVLSMIHDTFNNDYVHDTSYENGLQNSFVKDDNVIFCSKYKRAINDKLKVTKNNIDRDYCVIDTNIFRTNLYLKMFVEQVNNYKSSDEKLDLFNDLKREEDIYVKGIYDTLHFINTERKQKVSIDKQIRTNILTSNGNIEYDDLYAKENK